MFNWARMPDGCGMQAVGRAFQSWNDVAGSSFDFQFGGETQAAPGVHDGKNTVGSLSPWPFSHAWIAATIPWARYTKEAAELQECDTGLNTDDFQFRCDGSGAADEPDLQTIMLHEAGHWLRLRHVNSGEEIMQVASLLNRSRHTLGAGDVRGASHIYPGYGKGRLLAIEPPALCPAGDADSAVFEVMVTDGEGQPLAGVPAAAIWADAPAVAGGTGPLTRIEASGPTDARGRTRIVLTALSGPLQTRSLALHANGRDLPRPVEFEALSLDLSGDGRVGPEDILLAQALSRRPAIGLGLDTTLFRAHQGHTLSGGPPRIGKSVLSVFPTPFSTKVSMYFQLARGGMGEVEILDVTGSRVRRLWAGSLAAGDHSLEWDGRTDSGYPAASGVYVARVRVGEATLTRKLLRVR